jgi:hypothetical protein
VDERFASNRKLTNLPGLGIDLQPIGHSMSAFFSSHDVDTAPGSLWGGRKKEYDDGIFHMSGM